MTLLLYIAGPVSPTDASVDEVQRCEGGRNQSHACEAEACGAEPHYYQLWWFWLVCAVIFFLSCCCACHHRRVKHRLQQQQRQHEINLIAYREAHNSTFQPFYIRFLPNSLLPEYEEVMNHPPTPPPPYSALNSAPTACTTNDQQEALCPSRQATSVSQELDPLCSGPSVEHLPNHRGHCHKDASLPQHDSGLIDESMEESSSTRKQNICRKGQWKEAETEEKGQTVRRIRHFTGDSGIEVCVCPRDPQSCDHKELQALLSEEHQDDSADFCEGCRHRVCGAEDQRSIMVEQRAELLSQPHPDCMYLHTINELEGLQHIETESHN